MDESGASMQQKHLLISPSPVPYGELKKATCQEMKELAEGMGEDAEEAQALLHKDA